MELKMKLKIINDNPYGQNVFICYDGTDAVVIDPGDNLSAIKDFIADKNLRVKAILLTHGHYDHTICVNELREFTSAPVYAHADEAKLLQSADWNRSDYRGLNVSVTPDKFFEDGDIFEISDNARLKVIHTPGHTAGGVCYYNEDGGVIFTGDTLFRETIGRTDMPTGDHATLIKSVREKLFSLPGGVIAWPGHEESTTIEHEKQNNTRA
ncbi:MAG: MBL fold metallo-hydrolase [Defluviitaleaceae bacterium]|nr:MBL fold metallo-hydrolase [Defluviitaleaceae bacterium]